MVKIPIYPNVMLSLYYSPSLERLSTHVPAEELVKHVEFIRNLISSMVSDARRRKGGVGDGEFLTPGFNIPKGKRSLRRCIASMR